MIARRFAALFLGGTACLLGLGESIAQSADRELPWCVTRLDKSGCSYAERYATVEECQVRGLRNEPGFRCFNKEQERERIAASQKAWAGSIASKKLQVEPHVQEALELIFTSPLTDAFFSDVRTCVVEVWQKPSDGAAYLTRKVYLNTLDPRHARIEAQKSALGPTVYRLNVPGSSTAVEDFNAKGALSDKSKDLSEAVGLFPTSTEQELQRKMKAFAYLYSKQCKGTARPF